MRALVRLLAASLTPIAAVAAQVPPGAPMPKDLSLETVVPEQGAAKVRWPSVMEAVAAYVAAGALCPQLEAVEG
ncbi:MAG: hypothetical protein ACK51X_00075, partial [Planctomycetota bacterium]